MAVFALSSLSLVTSANAVPQVVVNAFDAGGSTTCSLRSHNDIYCVGENSLGQLGDETFSDKTEPVLAGVPGAQSVSVGKTSSCAIGADQKGYCWGDNSKGQLGIASIRTNASQIGLDSKLIDISVGDNFACAVTVEGKLYCWGEFINNSSTINSASPTLISSVTNVKAVSVGKAAVCVLTSDVYCFGSSVSSNDFTLVARSSSASSISVGDDFVCFVVANAVRCFGDNSQGQLGVGTSAATSGVVDVIGISDAVKVTAGAQHSCVVSSVGTVYCWGDNSSSQITSGVSDQLTRVPVSFSKSVGISAGSRFTCAMMLDASIKCLGDSASGQSALKTSSATPLSSPSTRDLASISSGTDTTCVIDKTGVLRCFGELEPELLPTQRFSKVAVGSVSACSITADGAVLCWGSNSSGQLGDNTNKTAVAPVTVLGFGQRTAISLSAGFRHFCAVMNDGLVMCWGDNSKDQLGFTGSDSKVALAVPGIGNAASVSLGDYHSCALLLTKKVMCWGDNSKRQITAETVAKLAPTEVSLTKDVSKVAAGGYNTCYLHIDATAECLGDNSESQAPGTISGNYLDIEVGGKTVCLLKHPFAFSCLGANNSNKLGRVGLKSATPVDFGFSIKSISVGTDHVCSIGILLDNLLCWGSNTSGQLGSSFGFPSAFSDPAVTLSGKPNVGETITASINNLEPYATADYSWYRSMESNGTYSKLSSQATRTLTFTASDQGRFYRSYVVLNKWGTSSRSYKSQSTTAIGVQLRLLQTPVPLLIGKPKVGQLLIARAGAWDSGAQLTYQWYRGGWVIKDATKPSYRLTAADVGKQISIAVTGFKSGYPKVTKKSVKTSKVTR